MFAKIFNFVMIAILLFNSFNLSTRISELENDNRIMKTVVNSIISNNEKMISIIKDQTVIQEQHIKRSMLLKKNQIDQLQITKYSSLEAKVKLTEDDMNIVINEWSKYVKGGTPFKNKGAAFIAASNATGLDPVYLLAHAAWETGWGNSYIAKTKNNYYGIAAYDHNPNKAYKMGSTLDEGIMNGAKWIKANYYDKGLVSLNSMIYGGKMYASDKDNWIAGISSIMRSSYKTLLKTA